MHLSLLPWFFLVVLLQLFMGEPCDECTGSSPRRSLTKDYYYRTSWLPCMPWGLNLEMEVSCVCFCWNNEQMFLTEWYHLSTVVALFTVLLPIFLLIVIASVQHLFQVHPFCHPFIFSKAKCSNIHNTGSWFWSDASHGWSGYFVPFLLLLQQLLNKTLLFCLHFVMFQFVFQLIAVYSHHFLLKIRFLLQVNPSRRWEKWQWAGGNDGRMMKNAPQRWC